MDETPRGVFSKRARISSNGASSSSSNNSANRSITPRSSVIDATSSRIHAESGSRRFNPFERHLIDRLHLPVWSPSTLQFQVQTPPQVDWTINQLSQLNPSNIEDSPSTHQVTETLSDEAERKLQSDITSFFDNHPLPSPTPMQSTPATSMTVTKVNKCVGTDLTLPWDIPSDIMASLLSLSTRSLPEGSLPPPPETLNRGDYRESHDDFDESHDLLTNTSFLRRKLEFSFDHHEHSDESDTEVHKIHGALIVSP